MGNTPISRFLGYNNIKNNNYSSSGPRNCMNNDDDEDEQTFRNNSNDFGGLVLPTTSTGRKSRKRKLMTTQPTATTDQGYFSFTGGFPSNGDLSQNGSRSSSENLGSDEINRQSQSQVTASHTSRKSSVNKSSGGGGSSYFFSNLFFSRLKKRPKRGAEYKRNKRNRLRANKCVCQHQTKDDEEDDDDDNDSNEKDEEETDDDEDENDEECASDEDREEEETFNSKFNNKSHYRSSSLLQTVSRRRMKSTSAYIYKTLFVDGEASDIRVKALGHEWNLHKVYLCQSPYFSSMLSPSNKFKWKESSEPCIDIFIPDQKITLKSLHVVFGSFYSEEINIVPLEAVSVLACASLFSLGGLIDQCSAVMCEHMNAESVHAFHEASHTYGLRSVRDKCVEWLCNNLMNTTTTINEPNNNLRLGEISPRLFEQCITSDAFMLVQVETDLYSLCKKWLYYQLQPITTTKATTANNEKTNKTEAKSQKVINEFFRNYLTESNRNSLCFLELDKFKEYASIFRRIRFQHIITDYLSLKLIYAERIVPHSWLEPVFFRNWMNVIYLDQEKQSNEFSVEQAEFDANCIRFGRTLLDDSDVTWRWVGFNYGLDLIVTHTNRTLRFRRNGPSVQSPYSGLLSNKVKQRIFYMIKMVQLDSLGNKVWSDQTELKRLEMQKSDEKTVMQIDSAAKYPLILNLRILTYPVGLSSSLLLQQQGGLPSNINNQPNNTTTSTPASPTPCSSSSS